MALMAGTIIESIRLPVHLWFLGIYCLTRSKNDVSTMEFKRLLVVIGNAALRMKRSSCR